MHSFLRFGRLQKDPDLDHLDGMYDGLKLIGLMQKFFTASTEKIWRKGM